MGYSRTMYKWEDTLTITVLQEQISSSKLRTKFFYERIVEAKGMYPSGEELLDFQVKEQFSHDATEEVDSMNLS